MKTNFICFVFNKYVWMIIRTNFVLSPYLWWNQIFSTKGCHCLPSWSKIFSDGWRNWWLILPCDNHFLCWKEFLFHCFFLSDKISTKIIISIRYPSSAGEITFFVVSLTLKPIVNVTLNKNNMKIRSILLITIRENLGMVLFICPRFS